MCTVGWVNLVIVSVYGEWVNLVIVIVYGEWVNLVIVCLHREWVNPVIVSAYGLVYSILGLRLSPPAACPVSVVPARPRRCCWAR